MCKWTGQGKQIGMTGLARSANVICQFDALLAIPLSYLGGQLLSHSSPSASCCLSETWQRQCAPRYGRRRASGARRSLLLLLEALGRLLLQLLTICVLQLKVADTGFLGSAAVMQSFSSLRLFFAACCEPVMRPVGGVGERRGADWMVWANEAEEQGATLPCQNSKRGNGLKRRRVKGQPEWVLLQRNGEVAGVVDDERGLRAC